MTPVTGSPSDGARQASGLPCLPPGETHGRPRRADQPTAGLKPAARRSTCRRAAAARRWRRTFLLAGLVVVLLLATSCVAADGTVTTPNVGLGTQASTSPSGAATGVQLLVLLTVLSLAPALLIMVTSFTRIIIVLSLVRNAIGVPQLPPNQVLLGIAFLLTIFVMAPVWTTVNHDALQPYLAGTMDQSTALKQADAPVRKFMLAQTREKDLELFVSMSQDTKPESVDQVPTYVDHPGLHPQRAEDRVPDGIHHLRALLDHRHRRLFGAAVDGHDDAATRRRLTALQDPALRPRGRMEPDYRLARHELRPLTRASG